MSALPKRSPFVALSILSWVAGATYAQDDACKTINIGRPSARCQRPGAGCDAGAGPGTGHCIFQTTDGVCDCVATTPPPPKPAQVQVYVSYAENERSPLFFPNPWYGSPNTQFLGYPGPAYDSGGILIVNVGTTNVVLGRGVTVDGFQDGTVYKLWDSLIPAQGLTIPPSKQVILAQTQADGSTASCSRPAHNCFSNFDSSDTPVNSAQSSATPVIHLTLNGLAQTFTDTGQILNTGGFDFGNRLGRNESLQWRLIGTTNPRFPGGSGVRPGPVSTYHNDNSRSGFNSNETTLTPGNVNATTFGKLFAYAVDGQIYAQPLFVSNVAISGKGTHNAVFVATENNSVYAFDAESNAPNGELLWGPISLGSTIPAADTCSQVGPTLGVTGTPVIDQDTKTLYVVSANKVNGLYYARLHALDLDSGAEKFGGPVDIAGSVRGTGDGTDGKDIVFDALQHFQRSALLLHDGSVYIVFGSHCDNHGYHGWLFGYDATDLTKKPVVFNTTPNAVSLPATPTCLGWNGWRPAGGALWMAGAGPAADGTGIYATTGNGRFDSNTSKGDDYGDTVLKVIRHGASPNLTVADYFTPFDQAGLECRDADLGASGPLLLPGSNPSLLVQASKDGNVYLVNRATGSMGKYNSSCGTPGPSCDHVVQVIDGALNSEVLTSPSYFNSTVYFEGGNGPIRAFKLANGRFAPTTPVAQSPAPSKGFGTASISYDSNASNPASTAIVWSIDKNSHNYEVLHAFRADSLNELYNSDAQGLRDSAGPTASVDFPLATIAAGKVFVGTANQLIVYGGAFFASWSGEGPFGGAAKQLAVGRNQDGRLEVFYVGTNDAIYRNYQTVPNNGWSGEMALGGSAKQIAVGQNQDGRLEIFYVGTNDAIYHNYQTAASNDTSWSGEIALGGYAKQISVSRNRDGRLEVFYVGTNDAIYHNYQTTTSNPNSWSGELSLGGYAKQIVAGQNQDGRLEIFYVGTDNAIYHNYQTTIVTPNSWSGEGGLGGSAKQIALGQNQDGRLELFYVGTNDAIYHNYQTAPNNGWSGEQALGGSASQIAAIQNQDGRLEIFYAATNAAIYHNYQTAANNGWNGEAALGGYAKQVAVGQNLDTRLELFYVGTNNAIYHNYQTVPNNRWNH